MTAPRGKPRSTTRRDLLRLRAALLVMTAVVFAGSLAAFTGVQSTVDEVTARTAPAVLEVEAARSALVQADNEAMTSFRSGQVQLIGPGEQYQSQIAITSQNLARVAENNSAGELGSQTLQLVEGLLPAYVGLIEKADVHFRTGGTTPLGHAELWYASRLMHQSDSGILAQLDVLAERERDALSETLSTDWMNPAGMLVWIVPIFLLLGLLCVAQVFGKRKFRRTVNPALAAATLLLLLVAGMTSMTLFSQARADAAGQTLNQVVDRWRAETDDAAISGQRDLVEVVREQCAEAAQDGCGDTVNAVVADLGQVEAGSGASQDQESFERTKPVYDELASANQSGLLEYLIAVGAVAIGVLILFGLQRGIDEYRYRST